MRKNPAFDFNETPEVRLLKAMANGQRLHILRLLAEHSTGLTVSELMERTGLRQSALSQHLGRLRDASLIVRNRQAEGVTFAMLSPLVPPILDVLSKPQRIRTVPEIAT